MQYGTKETSRPKQDGKGAQVREREEVSERKEVSEREEVSTLPHKKYRRGSL
jgi:hypothetical protein